MFYSKFRHVCSMDDEYMLFYGNASGMICEGYMNRKLLMNVILLRSVLFTLGLFVLMQFRSYQLCNEYNELG